jgi:hypothetical protein
LTFDHAEEAVKASAEVGGLADVGLGALVATKYEHRGRCGNSGKEFGIASWGELE